MFCIVVVIQVFEVYFFLVSESAVVIGLIGTTSHHNCMKRCVVNEVIEVSVLLFNQNDVLVDQVRYEPGGEAWPSRRPGEALELLEPAADNRDGAAWIAGEDSYGDGGKGSPGRSTR